MFVLLVGFVATISFSCAFTPSSSSAWERITRTGTTALFLNDDIADMIDRELWREHHKKDFENEWMEKNRGAVLSSLNADDYSDSNNSVMDTDTQSSFRQELKDRKLAKENPAAYCADRCVTTGNCEVYEDL